jgi:hypothetical protein
MAASPWIAIKALRQLGVRPVLLNALYRLGLVSGHYRRLEGSEQGIVGSGLRPLFVFPKPAELLDVIGEDGKAALLTEAGEIVSGKVRLFGAEPVELALTVPGKLEHWTAYETGKVDLRPLTFDIKLIWEPARFGWVFCLGRAFHLIRDEKYAESFWSAFETFTSSNPPYLGPNWMSGQEIALRIMAFTWAGQIFNEAAASTPERKAALANAVAHHAARIVPTIIYARSQQNNHLLTEAAGLLTAGLSLSNHPQASRWQALGWKWLNKGLQSQIDSSGEYTQHSTNYHRLMLQVVLWANTLICSTDFAQHPRGASRYRWPSQTRDAIQRSIHWSLSILDPASGRTPNLGANDGAYIFPLAGSPFSDHRPVVNAAARAFLNHDLPRGTWDEMALWFGIPLENRKVVPPPRPLDDRVYGKDSWVYLRSVQFTNRPSHADQLHVDLWWRSLNVAQDAGTYRYNADPPWDNSLTTALVHNTVTINGRDQFTRAGRFLYLDRFNAYRVGPAEADPAILTCMRAWHQGYRKLGIRHERTVTAFSDGHWQVRDDLLPVRTLRGRKALTFRLHWLLPDWEWQIEVSQPGMALRLISPYGPVELHFKGIGGEAASVDLVRAGERVYVFGPAGQKLPAVPAIRGWVSPTYDVKVPALSLAVEIESSNDVQFISEFIFPP